MGAHRSYVSGGSESPLVGWTVGDLLPRAATRWPDAEAVVSRHQAVRMTWSQMAEAVERLATGLLGLGVERGDRVAVLGHNRVEWLLSQHAVAAVGGELVGLNPANQAEETRFVLDHSGACVLLAATEFRGVDHGSIVAGLRRHLPNLRHVAHFDTADWDALAGAPAADDEESLRRVERRRAEVGFDDLACLQYTSGTTGRPKGVALTHHNVVNNALLVPPTLGWAVGRERVCVPVGFFHVFGAVLGGLAAAAYGTTIVLPSEGFDPASTLAALEAERCTAVLAVPTMYVALLDHPSRSTTDLTALRSGIVGGASTSPALFRRAVAQLHLPDLQIGYGMTESSPASVHTTVKDPPERRATTIGRPLPHTEAQIVDPSTGRTLPRGRPGELCVRGYLVMQSYWRDPEATRAAVDEGRWLHTGDLAVMDAEGYVRVVGRMKDVIVRGGENVAAAEVEHVLAAHPAVRDAHVVGVADPALGEEVFAWIRLRSDAAGHPSEDELRAWCTGRIARYKRPRYVRTLDELPTTSSGKVRKVELREWAEREVSRARQQTTGTEPG